MSNYDFLKSGFNLVRERSFSVEETVCAIMLVLSKGALTKLTNWCNHRGIINPNSEISFDLVDRFFKIETMLFLEMPDLNERINEVLRRFGTIDLETLDEELDRYINEFDTFENEPREHCDCNDCQIVENIENYWNNFNPTDPFIQLIKRNIDNLNYDDFFN